MKYSKLLAVAAIAVAVSSCKKDDTYEIPTTYNFENVSYAGQTQRLAMFTELSSYIKSANTLNGPVLDATVMTNMYRNENEPFTDVDGLGLNTTDKQIKNKVATSEQDVMETYFTALVTASQSTANDSPSEGVAGIVTKNDGSGSYLVDGNGVEWAQIIEKELLGNFVYYQISAVYLGDGKMNVDNETVEEGTGTAMQHHWDEAFGYTSFPTDFPLNTDNLIYLGKYVNARDGVLGINSTIMNGFLAGRAAIDNKDLGERDVQITIIRRALEKAMAGTAINYLNKSKEALGSDNAVLFHSLSEAVGFIKGLKFGGDATITASQVDDVLIQLAGTTDPAQMNFYQVTMQDLDNTINAITAVITSLESVKDQL